MQELRKSNFMPFTQAEKESPGLHDPQEHILDQTQKAPSKHRIVKKPNHKDEKMESQMRKIGFHLNAKGVDKNLFVKDLSAIIGNFFNPLINKITKKQRKLCQKLGYPLEQPNDEKIKTKTSNIFQQSKIQSPNSSKQNDSQKNIQEKHKKKTQIEELKNKKHQKRRIIRKIIQKPQVISLKRNSEEKILVKEMENKYGVKLKNNRLYMNGMPKKPVSSFFFFFKEYSTKIHEENQQLETTKELTYGSALAKRISQRWKEMTEQQKQPYYEKSGVTRKAYRDSMDAFKKQNKAVFDSFKKIKRVKANETRRIKIQKESLSLSKESIEEEVQVEVEENSESLRDSNIENSQGSSEKPINLEDVDELEIVIPDDDQQKNTKIGKTNRNRNLRERFKSVHKPKSPAPSFFFFYNQKKTQISLQHGVTRGARITQIASVMWRKLHDEEKRPYEILADDRRKKYYEQMKQFQAQHPEEWSKMQAYKRRIATNNLHGRRKKPVEVKQEESQDKEQNSESIEEEQKSYQIDSLEGNVIQKPQVNTKEKPNKQTNSIQIIEEKNQLSQTSLKAEEKIKNAPKRQRPSPKGKEQMIKKEPEQRVDYKEHRPKAPISSFFMFYKMNNSTLADQFKESNGGKLVKYASEIWKNMIDSEKRPYEIQSEQSRQNYYNEMEAYKQKYPEQIKQRRLVLKKRQEKAAQEGHLPKKKRRPSKSSSSKTQQKIEKAVGIKCEQDEN